MQDNHFFVTVRQYGDKIGLSFGSEIPDELKIPCAYASPTKYLSGTWFQEAVSCAFSILWLICSFILPQLEKHKQEKEMLFHHLGATVKPSLFLEQVLQKGLFVEQLFCY